MGSAPPELTENQRAVIQIAMREGNRVCVDCSKPNPEWASTNLGVFMCIECSGPHRSFGSHISKVRSVKLDKWDDRELLVQLDALGNIKSNLIYEAVIPEDPSFTRPTPETASKPRKEWLDLKYVERRFTADWKPGEALPDPTQLRLDAQNRRLEELRVAAADMRKRKE